MTQRLLGDVHVRHGHEAGEVTLGGRRVPIEGPPVRATDGSGEVALSVYRHFADRGPLSRIAMERMLAGVSCRRYGRTGEPLGAKVEAEARGVSRSSFSRTFIERTRQALSESLARRLDDARLAVLTLDGVELTGAHQRGGAGNHHRGSEGPARALGGLDPGAAASPREGMAETLTLARLGIAASSSAPWP